MKLHHEQIENFLQINLYQFNQNTREKKCWILKTMQKYLLVDQCKTSTLQSLSLFSDTSFINLDNNNF